MSCSDEMGPLAGHRVGFLVSIDEILKLRYVISPGIPDEIHKFSRNLCASSRTSITCLKEQYFVCFGVQDISLDTAYVPKDCEAGGRGGDLHLGMRMAIGLN